MSAKVAVAVIHGIAADESDRPATSDIPSFSADLHEVIRRRLPTGTLARDIAWREIFWADVLSERQFSYLNAIRDITSFDRIRRFLVSGIADAAAFHPRPEKVGSAYELIMDRVGSTMAELDGDVSPGAPLILLAHSFGGHILSSYLWDMQQQKFSPPTAFQRFQTLRRFVTFGTNIPLFTFACPLDDIHPIAFPGTGSPPLPWWENFYDRHDVLGFPMAPVGPRYAEMAESGALKDHRIGVGGILSGWTPFSHQAYWTGDAFTRPVTRILKDALKAGASES